jgi:hypothetical protein
MEADVARPAATFEYELASKDMMLAPPDERVKGMCVIVRSKRQQLCREVPNERRARPTFHAGSVSSAVCIRISILMQACAIENSPASAATNSEAVPNDYFFAPSACLPASVSLDSLTCIV